MASDRCGDGLRVLFFVEVSNAGYYTLRSGLTIVFLKIIGLDHACTP